MHPKEQNSSGKAERDTCWTKVQLSQGDALLLPPHWPHLVETIGECLSYSWWGDRLHLDHPQNQQMLGAVRNPVVRLVQVKVEGEQGECQESEVEPEEPEEELEGQQEEQVAIEPAAGGTEKSPTGMLCTSVSVTGLHASSSLS